MSADDLKARLRNFGHIYAYEAADRIEALELAMTQSQAEVAAAYERAEDAIDGDGEYVRAIKLSDRIRALATPEQTAALDTIRAEAREQGMCEAAEIARDHTPEKHSGATLASHVTGRSIETAILAAIKGAKA